MVAGLMALCLALGLGCKSKGVVSRYRWAICSLPEGNCRTERMRVRLSVLSQPVRVCGMAMTRGPKQKGPEGPFANASVSHRGVVSAPRPSP